MEIGLCKASGTRRLWALKSLDNVYPISFLDDASVGGKCGCGALISLCPSQTYQFFGSGGMDSNTRAKVLVLWGVLKCALWLAVDEIVVAGIRK